jgi:hypothetical protein
VRAGPIGIRVRRAGEDRPVPASEWIDETVPELMDDARWSASEEQLAMAIAQRIQRCHDTYVMVESVHWYESEVEEWTASRPSCVAGIWRTLKMRPKSRK